MDTLQFQRTFAALTRTGRTFSFPDASPDLLSYGEVPVLTRGGTTAPIVCSAELEFIARVARIAPSAADDARAMELASASLDWHRVFRLAAHHGVLPLMDITLARLASLETPSFLRRRVHAGRLASVGADLPRYCEWLRLCSAFQENEVPVITFKGFQAALSIYGELGLRSSGDLDFLVQKHDVAAALDILQDAGYALSPACQRAIDNVGLDYIVASTYEIALSSSRGVDVDLHWSARRPGTVPATERLFANAERMRVNEQDVLVPARDDSMVLLLVHGHESGWRRLRWLIDIVEGLQQLPPADVDAVRESLAALRMSAALTNALYLIEALWGRVPATCPASRRIGRRDGRMLRYAARSLEREHDDARTDDARRPLRLLRDRLGRSPTLTGALTTAIKPGFFDWSSMALPAPFRAGYYAVRPLRQFGAALRKVGQPARSASLAHHEWQRPESSTPCTFVTAIYDHGPHSLLGGRGRDISYYLPSLINIANLGAPIVVFCSAKDVDTIGDAIAPYFCEARVVPFELAQFEHYHRFLEWKKTYRPTLAINDRNEILCFLKSYWVQAAAQSKPFGHDRYFWIDAGLTHHGLFPERIGGVELRVNFSASHYYPRNRRNIFTPALGAAIANAPPPGKVLFCAMPFPETWRREPYEAIAAATHALPVAAVRIQSHLVGGIFGGRVEDLRTFHELYAELLAACIDSRTFTLEEQVFSALHAVRPDLFVLRHFQQWRFHIPGERTSAPPADGKSFYQTFTELI